MLKEHKNFSYLWKFSPVIPNGQFGEILKWKLHKLLKLICSSFNYWIKFVYTATASMSPQVRESGFSYPGHFCLWNPKSRKFCWWNPRSWVVESGIQFKESVIPLTIGIQNSSSTDKNWNRVPGIQNPQRGVQNPRLSRLVRVKSFANEEKCKQWRQQRFDYREIRVCHCRSKFSPYHTFFKTIKC